MKISSFSEIEAEFIERVHTVVWCSVATVDTKNRVRSRILHTIWEGATGWADTTMLHAEAKHPNCAYMWMEHSLSSKVQGDAAAWFGAVPSVPAACKGNALLTDAGCDTNGLGNFDKIHFWRTPVAKCASQAEGCVPYYRWVSDYIAVLGGR